MTDDFDKNKLPSWLNDDSDDDSKQDDNTAGTSTGKLGYTGDLPWLQQFGDKPDAEAEDAPTWQTDDEESAPADEADDALPAWMRADSADPELGEDDAAVPADLPPWMMDLQNTAPPPAPDEPTPATSTGSLRDQLSADFLAGADELPDTLDSAQTYDEWAAERERIKSGPNLEAETPDDLFGTFEDAPAQNQTGELPDWFLGLEELDEGDAPTWLIEDEPPAAPMSPADIPPWMTDFDEATAISPKPAPTESEMDDDFFALLGIDQPGETPRVPEDSAFDMSWLDDADSQAASSATSDDSVDDDFFAALGMNRQEAPAAPASASDEMDMSWLTDAAPEAEPGTPEADALPDDLFAMLGTPSAPADAPAQVNDFEFAWLEEADDLPDDAPAPVPAAPRADETPPPPRTTPPTADDFEFSWFEEAEDLPGTPPAVLDDDFVTTFGEPARRPEPRASDPYANFDFNEPVEESDEPNWLETVAQTGSLDWLDDAKPAEPPRSGIPQSAPSASDIDDFLAGLDNDPEANLPHTGALNDSTDFDLDNLFDDSPFEEFEANRAHAPTAPIEETLTGATPDFLRDLEASVGDNSAAALVRNRKNRPLDQLDDRLKKLHERGESLPASAVPADNDALTKVLPGVSDTLAPAAITIGLPMAGGVAAITGEQQRRIDLLSALVATEDAPAPTRTTAIDQTYSDEIDGLDDFEDVKRAAPAVPMQALTKRRRKRHLNLDRIVVSALLAAAMIAPFFVRALRLGDLPPGAFAAGSRGESAFAQVESLDAGDLVLIAVEYGPTSAAELDGLTSDIIRHALLKGARPVLISGNPVGLLHASNILRAINEDAAFVARLPAGALVANHDYYVVRYLTGATIGLRALGENTAALLLTDIRGQATGLNVSSLDDFPLIVVVTDRAEDVRNYAEQIAPITTSPVVMATGFTAAPLAEPYLASAGIDGLLVGYRDAYTYATLLGIIPPPEGFVAPVIVPPAEETTEPPDDTPVPTQTVTRTPAPRTTELGVPDQLATLEGLRTETAEARSAAGDNATARPPTTDEATDTPAPTLTDVPTNTTVPTETFAPTDTTEPDQPTSTPRPTNTPVPTAMLTRTPAPTATTRATATQEASELIGFIASNQAVNVRSGPSTSFGIVDVIEPREQVLIIGRNVNATWYRIRYEATGTEGWISATLLRIEGEGDPPVVAWSPPKGLTVARALPQQQTTDEPDVTDEPAGDPASPAFEMFAPSNAMPYHEERWYAMTMGIIASSAIIAAGAVVNLLRALFRRRRR